MGTDIFSLPERIKYLREQQHMTQADLARKVGLTRSSVNGWEMGLVVPSTAVIVELARIFHTTTDYLLGIAEDEVLTLTGLTSEEKSILNNLVDCFQKSHKASM